MILEAKMHIRKYGIIIVLLLISAAFACAQTSSAGLKVGDVPPAFSEKAVASGDQISLENYKGKVVLIDFWATWCGPCVYEIPNVKAAYEKYKDKGFEIIGISLDRERSKLEAFIKEKNITWPQIFDEQRKISNAYGVKAIPSTFIIDKEGKIAAIEVGGAGLAPAIEAALKGEPISAAPASNIMTTDGKPVSFVIGKDGKIISSNIQMDEKFMKAIENAIKNGDIKLVNSTPAAMSDTGPKVGEAPIPINEKGLDGKEISLDNYKGKVVLIDFWATWCGPCVHEIPNVKAAYEKYKDKGFEIIGISLDQDKAKLEAFIKEKNITWPQYFDGQGWKNKVSTAYGVKAIPATYLIGKDGKIVAKDIRGADLAPAIEKALAE